MGAKQRVLDSAFRAFDASWKIKNRARPRLLVYTDSRGMNVSTANMARVKHHYGSHVDWLQRRYLVDHVVCPYSHTTIVDFLNHLDTVDRAKYDAIVMECGIVEFSPRPPSNIAKVKQAKAGFPRFDEVFRANAEHHAHPTGVPYLGEATTTLFSPEFTRRLAEELAGISNLVWVTSNRFVPGWDGNWKARPADIDVTVEALDEIVAGALDHVIDLREWTLPEVQRYTVDNVHFTKAGFGNLARRVDDSIQRLV